MWANVLIVVLVLALFLLAFLLIRTILFGKAADPIEAAEMPEVEKDVIAEHLAAVLRCATISNDDHTKIDYQPFMDLRRELAGLYPRVHATLKLEMVNRHSLLYTWSGRDPGLAPVLLASHLDVVPIDPATRDTWKHGPFDGQIADGFVWGRGAIDNKNTTIAALEAVEYLLKAGYQPERTLLLAFGHDEEIGGQQGAAQIAGRLQASAIQLEAVLDEGGVVISGALPGISGPVAVVGVSEKGHLTLELTVESSGGHSSMPPPHTSIGVLSRAITRLEANPLPLHMEMVTMMFRSIGAYLPLGLRAVFANQWLFGSLLRKQLTARMTTNAMVRTTTAVTVFQGGVKSNLLPAQAKAMVNFRLMPGDRIADVELYARKIIDDEAVQLHIPNGEGWEASPVSPFDSPAARALIKTVGQVYPDALCAPYLVSGATDSRYYVSVCANVYRFSPMALSSEDLGLMHSANERIGVDVLARMVQFYILLTKAWTEKSGATSAH